jgi:hypothetical protein
MAGYGVTRQAVMHDGSSAQSSTVTSNSFWVGDANFISVSVQSVAAVASVWTIDGNNGDGFLTALGTGVAGTDWSTVTAITAQGIYSITPGMRWLRLIRPAANSQASVVLVNRST